MDGPVTRQSLHGIFHSRTAKRLIVALVLFSSFITALTTAIQLFIDYRRDLESIESAFALVETSYLESLTHSLWVVDAELIETQLAGLLRLPDVEYAAIRVDGEAKWSVGQRRSENVLAAEFPIHYAYGGQDLVIGTLEATASLDSVYRRLWDTVLIILASNGIKTFLVTGFVFLIFRRLVTRRVESLAQWVQGLHLDALVPSVGPFPTGQPGRQPDELDDLGAAIGEMHESQVSLHRSLKENEEQFRAVFEQAAVGIGQVAPDGSWLRVNQKLCDIVGYDESELLALTFQDITHADDLDSDIDLVRAALAGEIETYAMEKRYVRKDGSLVWINLTVSLVRHADGTPKTKSASLTRSSKGGSRNERPNCGSSKKNSCDRSGSPPWAN